MASVAAASFAFVFGAMFALWLLSLRLRDASIVDIFWGLGFVGIAWIAFAVGDAPLARRGLVAFLVSLWGLRLAGYLAWRNHGKPEDPRYQAMRRNHGARFPLVSLFQVFGLQGVIMSIVSLPVMAAAALPGAPVWSAFDGLGCALFAVGFAFESVGDWQLARFKADPDNAGRVMDRGLWGWTRHPNYFGDACVWWGLGAIGVAAGAWWALIGPAIMTLFLLRVSGVALLERGLQRSKPEYAAYVERTAAFFPRPPRRA